MTIKWKLPTADEPGFLRRRRDMTVLMNLPPTPENQQKLVRFLAPFVDCEEDEDAVEILLDASQSEYGDIVLVFLGYRDSISDPKGESSE